MRRWTLLAGPPCCFSRGSTRSSKREPRGSYAQTISLASGAQTAPPFGPTGRCALIDDFAFIWLSDVRLA